MSTRMHKKMIQVKVEPVTLKVNVTIVNDQVTDAASLDAMMSRVVTAQHAYGQYTQEQIDKIVNAVAMAANKNRILLAKLAVEETGRGIKEDKVIKNQFAAEEVNDMHKDKKTIGIIERNETTGTMKIATPLGVIAAIIPTTNPTSTTIFKILMALKTGNAIVISPHHSAPKCTIETAKILLEAAVKAGAPKDIISWLDVQSRELHSQLLQHKDTALILATGGPAMVKAAYSSGNPAIGVGAGNTPALIDKSADIQRTVNDILLSKTFDNGMICASEQSIIVDKAIYDNVVKEFVLRGAYILNDVEKDKLRAFMVIREEGKSAKINPDIVGKSAYDIAKMVGIDVPKNTKVLIGEVEKIGKEEAFSFEKLSPVLALYKADNFEKGVEMAMALERFGGNGHTSVLHVAQTDQSKIDYFGLHMGTGRTLINQPASHGAIGDLYNFDALDPALTLGGGSKSKNSFMGNLGLEQLMNIKTVSLRQENTQWEILPPRIFMKPGSLTMAIKQIPQGLTRAFVVTDKYLNQSGVVQQVVDLLHKRGIQSYIFDDVNPNPDTDTVHAGSKAMKSYKPDLIFAIGGGSPIDAAKAMKVEYDHPEVKFEDMAMRFMDYLKRTFPFPTTGQNTYLVAAETTAGTGTAFTPFSVITDSATHIKYPLVDYTTLTPNMAIVDSNLTLNLPKNQTAATGLDVFTHALEAYVSAVRTDFTIGDSLTALAKVVNWLPEAYEKGAASPKAREEMMNASAIAGKAFSNSFLGLNHSLAHALGSVFNIPHGVANALVESQVIRYNATDNPTKMPAFAAYTHPMAMARYAEVADHLKLGGTTNDEKVDLLVQKFEELKDTVNIPKSIQAWGIKAEDFERELDKMAELAFDDQCTGANPRYPLISEIKELYRDAFYGRIRNGQGEIISDASQQVPK